MTEKEVLEIKGLTNAQKERASAYFLMQRNLHRKEEMDGTESEIKEYLRQKEKEYEKRKENEKKRKEKKAQQKEEEKKIIELFKTAKGVGLSTESIIEEIEKKIKEKKNEKVLAKMAELEKQMEELKKKIV